jgi:hypothetical protein
MAVHKYLRGSETCVEKKKDQYIRKRKLHFYTIIKQGTELDNI